MVEKRRRSDERSPLTTSYAARQIKVLIVLTDRMKRQTNCFETVRMDAYGLTTSELRRSAWMFKGARAYLESAKG